MEPSSYKWAKENIVLDGKSYHIQEQVLVALLECRGEEVAEQYRNQTGRVVFVFRATDGAKDTITRFLENDPMLIAPLDFYDAISSVFRRKKNMTIG